jgi:hypothetical protein
MAQLTPGYLWTTGEGPTPTLMHQMVDESFLVNVLMADLLSTITPIYRTTPVTPATGDVRVGSDGLLEFYFGAAWTTQEADSLQLVVTNNASQTLPKGAVVVPDKNSIGGIVIAASNVTPDVFGVLATTMTSGATGFCYVRGTCQALVTWHPFPGKASGEPLLGPFPNFLIGGFPSPHADKAYSFFTTFEGGPIMSHCFATSLETIPTRPVFPQPAPLVWVRLGK